MKARTAIPDRYGSSSPAVSAIVLSRNRRESLRRTLNELERAPINEIIVVDNASSDGSLESIEEQPDVRVIGLDKNIGMGARNVGAHAATGDLLLLVDDDSHPLPGAVEAMVSAFRRQPRLAVVGGLIHDTDWRGNRIPDGAVGTFDWWLRCGQKGPSPPEGFPSNSFPECGCMIDRHALLEVGGFFEPFYLHVGEDELAARMLARQWDVRYLPQAEFDHIKAPRDHRYHEGALRYKTRNRIWFFLLRYPIASAVPRLVLFVAAELVEAAARGYPRAWLRGLGESVTHWRAVRHARSPIPQGLIPRVDMNRSRLRVHFVVWMARRVVRRRVIRGWRPR